MNQEKTPKELIEELYMLFSTFKQRMEDPNFIQVENTLNQLVENQNEMKSELRELKKQLLNPYDGVIVETRKNTDFRLEQEKAQKEYEELVEEHKSLVRFKSNVTKVGLAILTSAGAVVAFFLNKWLGL
jgi:molybdopterin converting factor small subunit